jgi:hypothetical protein
MRQNLAGACATLARSLLRSAFSPAQLLLMALLQSKANFFYIGPRGMLDQL